MNYSLLFISILALNSCKQSNNNNWYSFDLVDSDDLALGKVFCNLPMEFDTFYSWTSFSDSGCSEEIKYRGNSKKYKVIEDTQLINSESLDSGFYFTISHHRYISCDTQSLPWWITRTRAQIRKDNIEYLINDLKMEVKSGSPEPIMDTSEVIIKNVYDIFYFKEKYGNNPFNILGASTEYKNRWISFTIQSNVHSRESFYIIAMNILKSVKIE